MNESAIQQVEESALGRRRLAQAEDAGLKLAILCRTAAAAVGFVWYIAAVVATDQLLRGWPLVSFSLFITVGMAQWGVIGTRFNRWWMKYLLYAFDALIVCALFVVIPISTTGQVPQIIAFRAYGIYYLFPVVAFATLSLSWRLTLWTGAMVVVGWWGAFWLTISDMPRTLSWNDMPAAASRADYETIFLSIDFIGRGNRIEETGLLFVATAILALAVYRARMMFFAQILAQEKRQEESAKRQRIADSFGQYVPESLVARLIETGGRLPLRKSQGAILVMDIAGFSDFLSRQGPEVAIAKVDGFLADAADALGQRNGTVVSYTGDGILASFNAPVASEDPENAAVQSAIALLEVAAQHNFSIRIGLCAGELVSGSIGSNHRMQVTVYGDTVNRAARCEALCKQLQCSVLMDSGIAESAAQICAVKSVGSHELRGVSKSELLYTLLPEPLARRHAAPETSSTS